MLKSAFTTHSIVADNKFGYDSPSILFHSITKSQPAVECLLKSHAHSNINSSRRERSLICVGRYLALLAASEETHCLRIMRRLAEAL